MQKSGDHDIFDSFAGDPSISADDDMSSSQDCVYEDTYLTTVSGVRDSPTIPRIPEMLTMSDKEKPPGK